MTYKLHGKTNTADNIWSTLSGVLHYFANLIAHAVSRTTGLVSEVTSGGNPHAGEQ